MTIFINNIRRIFKDKANFILMFIFPMIFITMSMGLSMGGGVVSVGIVDHDKTQLTQGLVDNINKNNKVKFLDEKEIKKALTDDMADYVMVIPKGFTDSIISGNPMQIKGYSIKESNIALPAKYSINNFLSSVKNLGAASHGNSTAFYKALDNYEKGSFVAVFNSVEGKDNKGEKTLQALGFLIMSMLFVGNNSSQLILDDKVNKTFYRIFAGPITAKNYMLQNILSFLAIMVIQLSVILSIMKLGFHAQFGTSILNIFGLYILFGMFCVALGVAIMSISKDSRQAGALNTFLTVPMCMIGGCFWPRSFMPDILIKISNFMPTTWVLKASEKIINGSALTNVGIEILVLLLFTLVFVLLGSWRKTDITK